MQTFWAWSAKITLVILACAVIYIYNQHQHIQQLDTQNKRLETELKISQDLLTKANAKVAELDKKSLEGLMRETNKIVVSGWETLLGAVEEELEKAKTMIKNEKEALQAPSTPQPKTEKSEIVEPISGERT